MDTAKLKIAQEMNNAIEQLREIGKELEAKCKQENNTENLWIGIGKYIDVPTADHGNAYIRPIAVKLLTVIRDERLRLEQMFADL